MSFYKFTRIFLILFLILFFTFNKIPEIKAQTKIPVHIMAYIQINIPSVTESSYLQFIQNITNYYNANGIPVDF